MHWSSLLAVIDCVDTPDPSSSRKEKNCLTSNLANKETNAGILRMLFVVKGNNSITEIFDKKSNTSVAQCGLAPSCIKYSPFLQSCKAF